jgi:hypothetical protein
MTQERHRQDDRRFEQTPRSDERVPLVGDVLAFVKTSTSRSMPARDVDRTSCFSVPSTADTLPTMERPTCVFMIAIDRPVFHYNDTRPREPTLGIGE